MNSYKRLVPGYEAPVYVAWSRRNRSALIRIPLYKPGNEQATRAEIRCPDPACNPYLTFAALLHAGLEGIEKGYELPEPMETNLYHLTAEQRKERGIVVAPGDARGGDRRARRLGARAEGASGTHIFDRYVELKRKEWDDYRVQLTDWEQERYSSVLWQVRLIARSTVVFRVREALVVHRVRGTEGLANRLPILASLPCPSGVPCA